MSYTRTKAGATPKEIKDSMFALDVLSGRTTEPDYIGRRDDMRRIESMPLTPQEYERLSNESAIARRI